MWISESVYPSTYTHSCFYLCVYMAGTALLQTKVTIPSSALSASLGKDPLKGTRLCLKAVLPVVLWARREKHTGGKTELQTSQT